MEGLGNEIISAKQLTHEPPSLPDSKIKIGATFAAFPELVCQTPAISGQLIIAACPDWAIDFACSPFAF